MGTIPLKRKNDVCNSTDLIKAQYDTRCQFKRHWGNLISILNHSRCKKRKIVLFITFLIATITNCHKFSGLSNTNLFTLVLEVRSPKWVLRNQSQGASRAGSFWRLQGRMYPLPAFRGCSYPSVCGYSILISAAFLTLPSSIFFFFLSKSPPPSCKNSYDYV